MQYVQVMDFKAFLTIADIFTSQLSLHVIIKASSVTHTLSTIGQD
jgi:hypothetical protein